MRLKFLFNTSNAYICNCDIGALDIHQVKVLSENFIQVLHGLDVLLIECWVHSALGSPYYLYNFKPSFNIM